jgi:hypothetical protein
MRTDAAMQFERIVERAFKQAGFAPVASPRPDYGADFALASPVLSQAFGSPLLIEVKNNRNEPLQRKAVDGLSRLIQEGRGGAGLLVTAVQHRASWPLQVTQPIAILPFSDVIEWLRDGTFELEFLSRLDNKTRSK